MAELTGWEMLGHTLSDLGLKFADLEGMAEEEIASILQLAAKKPTKEELAVEPPTHSAQT